MCRFAFYRLCRYDLPCRSSKPRHLTPRFCVPWKDIQEGIGNIFVQQFTKDQTIAAPFSVRIIPPAVFKVFLDRVCPSDY